MITAGAACAAPPVITKEPVVDTAQVLSWSRDFDLKIKGEWTDKQKAAADHLYAALLSDDFKQILQKHGLKPTAK
jgi:hypothetical protein